MPKDEPLKIAKILANIAYINAGEYGLFWDEDGTMPWKELYWVLQRQGGLSHIKSSYINQLEFLGINIPFTIENNLLKLKEPLPEYPIVNPPSKLFYSINIASIEWVKTKGLYIPSNRSYLALWSNEEDSLLHSKPGKQEKITIAIDSESAIEEGILFFQAGPELYLVNTPILPHLLHIPPVKQKLLDSLKAKKELSRKKKIKDKRKITKSAPTPGSFIASVEHFKKALGNYTQDNEIDSREKPRHSKKKGKGPDWKRQSRKIRKTKRSI